MIVKESSFYHVITNEKYDQFESIAFVICRLPGSELAHVVFNK